MAILERIEDLEIPGEKGTGGDEDIMVCYLVDVMEISTAA